MNKPVKNKEEFIFNMLNYATKENSDPKLKERVLKLICKEEKKNTKDSYRVKINHKPIKTVELLRLFKYNNDSGLKELVHTPTREDYTWEDFKNDVEKAREFYKGLKNVPYQLYLAIDELIKLMANEGVECFKETGKHPYLNDKCKEVKNKYEILFRLDYHTYKTITTLVQAFKRNYRFDVTSSEASVLKDLIVNSLNKRHFKDTDNEVEYQYDPKLEKSSKEKLVLLKVNFSNNFDEDAIFFTWVPYIRSFLIQIFDDILKHGNINGNRNFNSYEKEILFEIIREYDENLGIRKINFIIFDKYSFVNKNPETFFKQIKEKATYLKGLCDWTIKADFRTEKSFRFSILPETTNYIKELNSNVYGLKHILTFYEL